MFQDSYQKLNYSLPELLQQAYSFSFPYLFQFALDYPQIRLPVLVGRPQHLIS